MYKFLLFTNFRGLGVVEGLVNSFFRGVVLSRLLPSLPLTIPMRYIGVKLYSLYVATSRTFGKNNFM